MAVDAVIKGGEVVTACETMRVGIAINKGKIVAIADEANLPEGKTTIDARGRIVIPGVIDPHVHTGYAIQHKLDNFESASISAAYGGVTTILPFFAAGEAGAPMPQMPVYSQVITSKVQVEEYFGKLIEECQHSTVVDFGIHWSLYSGDGPAHIIAQIPKAIKMGIRDIKIQLGYFWYDRLLNDLQVMEVMDIVANNGGLVMVHCENGLAVGYMENKYESQGRFTKENFLDARPNMLEAEAVYRICALASVVGCPIYIVHNTTKQSVGIVRDFKMQGQNIIAETCPQYLLFTHQDMVEKGTGYKVGPPLRTTEDQAAIWQGIQQGVIDTIGTDHAPADRTNAEKLTFRKVAYGMPGLETVLPLIYSEGVVKGKITLNKMVEILSTNVAKSMGIFPQKGSITVGADGDLVIIDPSVEWEIKASELHSKAGYTPYEGWRVKGRPVVSLLRGEVLLKDGKLHKQPGFGQYLARKASK